MAGLLSDAYYNAEQRALDWLQQQGVKADCLTPLPGYTNHVFLVEQSAASHTQRSVLRLADFSLSADLCPLAHQFNAVLQRHVAAAELGLSPEVIAADEQAGVMWLRFAGEQKPLKQSGFTVLRGMLNELYQSGVDWGVGGQVFLKELLQQNITVEWGGAVNLSNYLQILTRQAQQRGYFDYLTSPIHGDLNPSNLLHDNQRWWLIDWDFSGMQIREWDLAGLIVEHNWDIEQALAFAPELGRADIKWFCSCFALLSWHWHVQRGSERNIISGKAATMQYWITLKR